MNKQNLLTEEPSNLIYQKSHDRNIVLKPS